MVTRKFIEAEISKLQERVDACENYGCRQLLPHELDRFRNTVAYNMALSHRLDRDDFCNYLVLFSANKCA